MERKSGSKDPSRLEKMANFTSLPRRYGLLQPANLLYFVVKTDFLSGKGRGGKQWAHIVDLAHLNAESAEQEAAQAACTVDVVNGKRQYHTAFVLNFEHLNFDIVCASRLGNITIFGFIKKTLSILSGMLNSRIMHTPLLRKDALSADSPHIKQWII